jgi:hypothetical protein
MPLASALARRESSIDFSPDNKRVVFTANRTGAVGAQLQVDGSLKLFLFELDIATQKIRERKAAARYVRFAPGGKKLLLTNQSVEQILSSTQQLIIADAGLTRFETIAKDCFAPAIAFSPEQCAFPGWIDDQRLFYFTERLVYGMAGRALAPSPPALRPTVGPNCSETRLPVRLLRHYLATKADNDVAVTLLPAKVPLA